MNILVVDDEVSIAEVIKKYIEKLGHDVEIAFTGQGALKMMREKVFDLIVLDIYLPDCMGHELIPEFKKARPDIGIVTITGYNSKELELEVREKGIIFFMVKPFNINEMTQVLIHYQKKKTKRDEIAK